MLRIGKLRAAVFVALSLMLATAVAQDASPPDSLFLDETPLALKISAPFRELARADEDRPEFDAVIEFADWNGSDTAIDIEVRIRGRSRLDNCDFPPLSLDFPRDEVDGTLFTGQNRLKLVTQCKQSDSFRDYLTHEFLIYRMLNQLTDRSFRVRWATVEYVYTDANRERSRVEPAFLIEGDWEVAQRLGMQAVEIEEIAVDELDAQYAALMSLFHYMIGNTDWATILGPPGELCCHNGKVIGNSGEPFVVLPYDFDNSGLVSASYAVPSDILPIRSVRRRLYRGYCATNHGLTAAMLHINQHAESLRNLLDDESLSDRARERALDYLDEFFEIINDPEERQEQIHERCLN